MLLLLLVAANKTFAASGLDSNVALLLRGNGADSSTTFTDSSPSARAINPAGNAQIDTAQSKFGGASMLFDGAGDYLTIGDDPALELGSGNFTIDLWFRTSSITFDYGYGNLVTKRSASTSWIAPFIIFRDGSTIKLYSSSDGSSWDVANNRTLVTGLNVNTWYHFAFVRSGNTFYTFLNGIQTDSFSNSSTLHNNAAPISIGGDVNGDNSFIGHVDEFRYSVGVARWTGNFTPPTEEYGFLGLTINFGARFLSNLDIRGTVSKGVGTFVIDHPQDPARKILKHSFLESPEAKNIYEGIAKLDEKGEITIELPEYFEALNKDFRYQFFPMEQAMPNLYIKRKVKDNRFIIAGGKPFGTISWQVTGVRHDPYIEANPIRVEVEKGPGELVNKGECLHAVACP